MKNCYPFNIIIYLFVYLLFFSVINFTGSIYFLPFTTQLCSGRCIHLGDCVKDQGKKARSEGSFTFFIFICVFILKVRVKRNGRDRKWESYLLLVRLCEYRDSALRLNSIAFPGTLAGSWIGTGAVRTQNCSPYGMPLSQGRLACSTTVPARSS